MILLGNAGIKIGFPNSLVSFFSLGANTKGYKIQHLFVT
jgi:hypothetical protein